MLPPKYIKRYLVLPFKLEDKKLFTAMGNPRDMNLINDLQFIVGCRIVPFVAGEYFLIKAIERKYNINISGTDIDQTIEEIDRDDELEFVEVKEEESLDLGELEVVQKPVVRLVNLILKEAVAQEASDIHIEPYEDDLRVRFRVDGTLSTVMTPPAKYQSAIVSRIKVMSRIDISERRLPQDGRFKIKIEGKCIDFRVSTFPGGFGEKVVLRLLDKTNLTMDINNLGMQNDDLNTLLTSISKTKGMVLVTGPTGSGKTTTLYSILQHLNNGSNNISTAEDPIEYNFHGINQFQMNHKIGLDFAMALRTFLRQDPDIIMVGEMRDLETAQIAVKAALTGHLLLSTLHTNSATETITRLLDIGVEPFMVATSIDLIIAQRLMRKICPNCKEKVQPDKMHQKLLQDMGINPSLTGFYAGKGCSQCNYTGYKGRFALYEVLPMWHQIREMIIRGESSMSIENQAKSLGLKTLKENGIEYVLQGVTTIDEWLRVTM